ncbi:MAG: alpha-amylase family glycosyl hydrolase [Deltaproteobacteria bacterium]
MPRRARRELSLALALATALPLASAGCFNLDEVSGERITLTTQVSDWRDEVIYQILIDRFADSDPGNNERVNRTSLARYQGGDWQGVIDHMDYFVDLGVTTLWISPVVRNVDNDAGIDGYHGYWSSDLAELNPHFGDLATLRRLVREAHSRHLRVVLDIVTNHMGQMFYYDINQNGRPDDNVYGGGPNSGFENPGGSSSTITRVTEYDPDYNARDVVQSYTSLGPAGPAPVVFLQMPEIYRVPPDFRRDCPEGVPLAQAPLSCNSWQRVLATNDGYHRRGRIVSYDNVGHQPGDQVMLGDFPGGLKDVATENPAVRAAMIQAYARWVELTDLDGFRIDTLKHVEHGFWSEFAPGVRTRLAARGKNNFFMFGEAFDGDDELISSYTAPNEVDSVFYFSQKFRVYRDVFQCEGPTSAVEAVNTDRLAHYSATPQPGGANAGPRDLLVNFFDNHDVPRFLAGIFDEDPTACPSGRVNSPADFAAMQRRMYAALTFMFTEPGIPCVYYGTEQDFHGANDPSNREVLWDTRFPTNGTSFQRIAQLTRIRRTYSALRRGAYDFTWTTTHTGAEEDAGILAFERTDGADRALVVINAHSAAHSHTASGGNAMTVHFAPGTALVNALGDTSVTYATVGSDGRVTIELDPWESVILVPRS